MYRGDVRLGKTIDFKFTTVDDTGAPTTLAGTPVVSAYVNNSITQITAGITLTVDFDGVTGLHNVRAVLTSGNGYASGDNIDFVITTGTVGGTSVVGYVIGSVSIQARSALMPTTEDRTLDVTATGAAGVDWGNVENPTTTVGLTNTTVGIVTLLNGLADNIITAAKIATGALTSAKFAAGAFDAVWSVATRILTAATNITSTGGTTVPQTGDSFARLGAPVGASISADIAAVQTGVNDVPTNAELAAEIDAVQADIAALNDLSAVQVEDAVWDAVMANHLDSGSTGAALNAAGAAGDPWSTSLPGAYGAGTAGNIIGNNLNATVSSRATQTSVDDIPTNAELASEINAVQADIAALPTAAENATAVWSESLPGLFGAGEAGKLVGDNIDATISSRATPAQVKTQADQALADVGLTVTITGRIDAAVSTRASQTSVDDIPTVAEFNARTLVAADYATATAVADLPTNAELAAEIDAVQADIAALSIPTAAEIATEVLVNTDVETGINVSESLQLANAANAGKLNGAATTTVNVRDLADSKNRIVATVDADGNRTAVTRNLN